MTEPTDFDSDEAELPGLGEPAASEGAVERAARRTIAALAPGLDDRHAVICQALLTCAHQLDRAASSGKAKDYGVANLLAQLRDTYLVLMPAEAEGGETGDAWDRLVADLQRSGPAVRHEA